MPTQSTYTAVALPADGQTIDAADVNTDLTGLINQYNLNIGNSKIDAAAAIDFSKLASAAWTSWVPTWTSITVGNAVQEAAYIQIGKIVLFRAQIQLGTTSSISGNVLISYPVVPKDYRTTTPNTVTILGTANMRDDSSGNQYVGSVAYNGTASMAVFTENVAGTYGVHSNVSGVVPFTVATSDGIFIQGFYEAA